MSKMFQNDGCELVIADHSQLVFSTIHREPYLSWIKCLERMLFRALVVESLSDRIFGTRFWTETQPGTWQSSVGPSDDLF